MRYRAQWRVASEWDRADDESGDRLLCLLPPLHSGRQEGAPYRRDERQQAHNDTLDDAGPESGGRDQAYHGPRHGPAGRHEAAEAPGRPPVFGLRQHAVQPGVPIPEAMSSCHANALL